MQIYVALRDSDAPQSYLVGAFSTEEKAQQACQEHSDDIADGWDDPRELLRWHEAEAASNNGSTYAVVLVDLDTPN